MDKPEVDIEKKLGWDADKDEWMNGDGPDTESGMLWSSVTILGNRSCNLLRS
jgi:hypothetical protein